MEFGRAAKWSAIGGALGWSFVAWGQATSETGPPAGGDLGMLLEILQSGGLPVVLAWAAWQVRGLAMSGIPLRVQLHPEDRRLIEEIRDGRQPTQDTSQR